MNDATIVRGLRRYRELMLQIDALKADAEKIREWMGVHAAGTDTECDGIRVTVKTETRISVDNKALKEAALKNPALLEGLSATWSVPAKYKPTRAQMAFITEKPAPTAIKFYTK